MINSVLRIMLLSVLFQPLFAYSEPYKCLILTENNTDFIQYFDIGDYNKTFHVASQISTVRLQGRTLGVSHLVACIPSASHFSSFSARELDKNRPK